MPAESLHFVDTLKINAFWALVPLWMDKSGIIKRARHKTLAYHTEQNATRVACYYAHSLYSTHVYPLQNPGENISSALR